MQQKSMDLDIIILSKVSKKEKDKCHIMESKKTTNMNLPMKQKQTHRHRKQNRLVVAGGRAVGEGRFGIWGLADANYYT